MRRLRHLGLSARAAAVPRTTARAARSLLSGRRALSSPSTSTTAATQQKASTAMQATPPMPNRNYRNVIVKGTPVHALPQKQKQEFQSQSKKGFKLFGMGWGWWLFFSVVGSVGHYFWRSSENTARHAAVEDWARARRLITYTEMKALRNKNDVSLDSSLRVLALLRERFPKGWATLRDLRLFLVECRLAGLFNDETLEVLGGTSTERLAKK